MAPLERSVAVGPGSAARVDSLRIASWAGKRPEICAGTSARPRHGLGEDLPARLACHPPLCVLSARKPAPSPRGILTATSTLEQYCVTAPAPYVARNMSARLCTPGGSLCR